MQLASGRLNSSLMLHALNCENFGLLHMLSCGPRSCMVPSSRVRYSCSLHEQHKSPYLAFLVTCPSLEFHAHCRCVCTF